MKTIEQYIFEHILKGHLQKQYKNIVNKKLKNLTEEQKQTIENFETIFFSDKENKSFSDPSDYDKSIKYFKEDIVVMFLYIAACLVLDNSIKYYKSLGLKQYKNYGTHNPYDSMLQTFEYADNDDNTALDYIITWCAKSPKNYKYLEMFCDIYKANKDILGEPDHIVNLLIHDCE